MVQKINLLVFQLDRQEQYIRRENILIYGVEENKEDNDDGEKVLFKIADELEVNPEDNEIQRVHRLGQKRRNNENPRQIIARFVSSTKRNEFLTKIRELQNIEGSQHVFVCEDQFKMHGCENMWLEILGKRQKIIIGIVYRHPKYNIDEFSQLLSETITEIAKNNYAYYVLGDININLLNATNDSRIQQYIDTLCSLGCHPIINKPTRVMHRPYIYN